MSFKKIKQKRENMNNIRLNEYISRFKKVLVSMLMLSVYSTSITAQEMTAREIMDRYDARDDGNTLVQDIRMILIDKNGNKRVREILSYEKKYDVDEYRVMFFKTPTDIHNTGFLTYDYKDSTREDKQWLYLPAIKKVKRIPTVDKSSSFMGSDFSYFDMTDRDLDKYTFRIIKESKVRGNKVWMIEAIPNDEEEIKKSGYTKSILFIRQKDYVGVRAILIMKNSKKKLLDVKEMHKQDGVWVFDKVKMITKKGRKTIHTTILLNSNIKLNTNVKDVIFTARRLEKGI